MLKKITIKGYRGFRTSTPIPLATPNGQPGSGYNVFVGPNNSGKTTSLEAIKYYHAPAQNISFSEGKRNTKSKKSGHVKIDYLADDGAKFTVETVPEGGSQVIISGEANIDEIPYVLQSRRYTDYEMHNPYPNQNRGNFIINQINNTRNRSYNLSGYEERIFRWREQKAEFDKMLHQIIIEPFDWTIEQSDNGAYYIKMIFANGSIIHTREGVGDGYWSIFTVVDALYDSKPGSIIAIDEPELSLHPSMQKRIIKIFEEYSANRQIIVTTHSPYFISINSILNMGSLIRFHKSLSGDIMINTIDADDRAFIKSTTTNVNNPHILGHKALELFFAENGLVITEGQDDVIIISRICRGLGLHIHADFFGWGAGGMGNIPKILHMLRNLGYDNISAIYDGDKTKEYKNCKDLFPEYNILILPKDDIRDKPATPPRTKKEGLADEHGNLKPENKAAFIKIIDSINSYNSTE